MHIDDSQAAEGIRNYVLLKVADVVEMMSPGELTWVTFPGRERAWDANGVYARPTGEFATDSAPILGINEGSKIPEALQQEASGEKFNPEDHNAYNQVVGKLRSAFGTTLERGSPYRHSPQNCKHQRLRA